VGWGTYCRLAEGLAAKRVVDLVLPRPFYPREHLLIWNVLDLGCGVILGIVFEDDAHNLVLCPPEPAFLNILKDDLQAGLGACDVACVGDGYAEGACRLCELSFMHASGTDSPLKMPPR
jgi:hypothetical protein